VKIEARSDGTAVATCTATLNPAVVLIRGSVPGSPQRTELAKGDLHERIDQGHQAGARDYERAAQVHACRTHVHGCP